MNKASHPQSRKCVGDNGLYTVPYYVSLSITSTIARITNTTFPRDTNTSKTESTQNQTMFTWYYPSLFISIFGTPSTVENMLRLAHPSRNNARIPKPIISPTNFRVSSSDKTPPGGGTNISLIGNNAAASALAFSSAYI